MALQTIPGFTGLTYARMSSMDGRAIGKLTDSNHLESLQHDQSPTPYDKKVIDIYTQSSLFANDFLSVMALARGYGMKFQVTCCTTIKIMVATLMEHHQLSTQA